MNQLTTIAETTRTRLELAKAFAESKLIPDHFKKSVGDCFIAISLAENYRMQPWMLMQEMYLIQGKPFMSGKMATAILNNSLADPLRPEYSGEGDEREITLTGRPEGEANPLIVKLKVKDAKTANEQWKKNPDQMLMYAAARMWGRRYTPDILMGIQFLDEADEILDTTMVAPKQNTLASGVAGSTGGGSAVATAKPEVIDQETGEVLDHPVALAKNPNERWYDWGARLVACVRNSPDIGVVDQWLAANAEMIAECRKDSPKVAGNIDNAVKQAKLDLVDVST